MFLDVLRLPWIHVEGREAGVFLMTVGGQSWATFLLNFRETSGTRSTIQEERYANSLTLSPQRTQVVKITWTFLGRKHFVFSLFSIYFVTTIVNKVVTFLSHCGWPEFHSGCFKSHSSRNTYWHRACFENAYGCTTALQAEQTYMSFSFCTRLVR